MSEDTSRNGAGAVPGRPGGPGRQARSPFARRSLAPLLVLFLSLPMLLWLGRPDAAALLLLEGGTMGSSYSLQLRELPSGYDHKRLASVVQARLDRLDKGIFSTWTPDSELSRLNRAPLGGALPVSPELLTVLSLAAEIRALSAGAFDVTVGPLVDLWGFGPVEAGALPPHAEAIDAALARVDGDALTLDPLALTVHKRRNVQIDLSAVAKGYAVDALADWLEEQGVRDYLLEIGGELRLRGERAPGEAWRVAIEEPLPDERRARQVLAAGAEGLALAASGDYRNFRGGEDDPYPHVIDPRSGLPVTHELASVTVLDSSAARADALATALLVLGPEEGWRLASGLGLPAYFIMRGFAGLVSRSTDSFDRYLLEEASPGPGASAIAREEE